VRTILLIFVLAVGFGVTHATSPIVTAETSLEGRWEQVEATNALPPPRRDAALGYDAARNRVILFGGRSGGSNLNDTWAFDLKTRTWEPLATGGVSRPPARFSMVAGMDAARNRFLIATGQDDGFFNDVWSFDLLTDSWTQVTIQGGPPPARYGSAGGIAANGAAFYVSHGFTDQGRFDDTWELDLATDTWHNVTPTAERPLPRCLHAGTLAGPSSLILFGGCASGFGPCPLGDTWQFDTVAGSWEAIPTPETLAPRIFPTLVPLGDAEQVLLFGGEADGTDLNDTWLLDTTKGSWTPVETEGQQPVARQGHSMIWVERMSEATGGAALLFGGGRNGDTDLNDLWLFRPDDESLPVTLFLPMLQRLRGPAATPY
jgi:hypothetical protein